MSKTSDKKIASILHNKKTSRREIKSQFADFTFILRKMDGFEKLVNISKLNNNQEATDQEAGFNYLLQVLKTTIIDWKGVTLRDILDEDDINDLSESDKAVLDDPVPYSSEALGFLFGVRFEIAQELIIAVANLSQKMEEEKEEVKKN